MLRFIHALVINGQKEKIMLDIHIRSIDNVNPGIFFDLWKDRVWLFEEDGWTYQRSTSTHAGTKNCYYWAFKNGSAMNETTILTASRINTLMNYVYAEENKNKNTLEMMAQDILRDIVDK